MNKPVSLPIVVTMCTVVGRLPTILFEKVPSKLQLESSYYCRKNTHNRLSRSVSPHDAICISLVGASLSEPHMDELNVRNVYIIIYVWYVRHLRAAIYIVQSARYISEAA